MKPLKPLWPGKLKESFSPLLVGVLSETQPAPTLQLAGRKPFSPLLVGVLSETMLEKAKVLNALFFQSPTGRGAQ